MQNACQNYFSLKALSINMHCLWPIWTKTHKIWYLSVYVAFNRKVNNFHLIHFFILIPISIQLKKLPPMVPEKYTSSSSSSAAMPQSTAASSLSNSNVNDEMRIAWRYNNLNKVDSEQGGTSQMDAKNSYTFDLSQSIDDGTLKDLDVTMFGKDESNHHSNVTNKNFHNPAYVSLIQTLRDKMADSSFGVDSQTATTISTTSKKNLLRICIESLGSPLWYDEYFSRDFCLFLSVLKAAVRVSLSVCCITVPAYLFKCIVSVIFNNQYSYSWHHTSNNLLLPNS